MGSSKGDRYAIHGWRSYECISDRTRFFFEHLAAIECSVGCYQSGIKLRILVFVRNNECTVSNRSRDYSLMKTVSLEIGRRLLRKEREPALFPSSKSTFSRRIEYNEFKLREIPMSTYATASPLITPFWPFYWMEQMLACVVVLTVVSREKKVVDSLKSWLNP